MNTKPSITVSISGFYSVAFTTYCFMSKEIDNHLRIIFYKSVDKLSNFIAASSNSSPGSRKDTLYE